MKVVPYEADDLLATSVTLEKARGGQALVVSGDRDMYQLVSDATTVLSRGGDDATRRADRDPGRCGAPAGGRRRWASAAGMRALATRLANLH